MQLRNKCEKQFSPMKSLIVFERNLCCASLSRFDSIEKYFHHLGLDDSLQGHTWSKTRTTALAFPCMTYTHWRSEIGTWIRCHLSCTVCIDFLTTHAKDLSQRSNVQTCSSCGDRKQSCNFRWLEANREGRSSTAHDGDKSCRQCALRTTRVTSLSSSRIPRSTRLN